MGSVASSQGLTTVSAVHSFDVPSRDRGHLLKSGLGAALLANLLWGTSFLASKYTLTAWGPFTASTLRFGVATLLMIAGMRLFGRKIKRPQKTAEWIGIFAVAVTGFGFLYPLQLWGLESITSGMSAAIMLTSPLFMILAGRAVLKDRFDSRKLIAIALGIGGGLILLFGAGKMGLASTSSVFRGTALTFTAAISLALSAIATKRLSKTFDSGSITVWSMGFGFLLLLLSSFAFERESLFHAFSHANPNAWAALFFLASVCSAFCFFAWNFAISKASPKEIASTMHLKTPTAVLFGAIVAHEHVGAGLIFGTLIVALGVWLSQTSAKRAFS